VDDIPLLTCDQIEACLRLVPDDDDFEFEGSLGICPITELLELCEQIKKQHPAGLAPFRRSIEAIQNSTIQCEWVLAILIPLDQRRLTDSLFERDAQFRVNGLWAPGSDIRMRCMHSVRRLLLRPAESTWWDYTVYDRAEEIYAIDIEDDRSA
jgi:hypothetical protein